MTLPSEDDPTRLERAIALARAGDFPGASRICEEILAREPADFGAVNLVGAIAFMRNEFETAVASFTQAVAIDPNQPIAHANLGLALNGVGRVEEGRESLVRAISLDPASPEAFCNLGLVLHRLGRRPEAEAALERAVQLRPGYIKALHRLGDLRLERDLWEEAIAFYDAALAAGPENAPAHLNRGYALERLGRWDEALAGYDAAIEVQANYAGAWHNRGGVLCLLGRLDEAIASCDTAIRLAPDAADAHVRRGAVLEALARFDDALISYDEAIARDPSNADAHVNRAGLLLRRGDFAEGWAEAEWRAHRARGERDYAGPEWTGAEDIAGKTVFVDWEQGYGDTLQYCRYARLIKARGARVVMSVQSELVSLLSSLGPGVEIIGVNRRTPPAFDFHIPLMSLPFIFKTDLTNIPAKVPYLRPAPRALAQWRKKLGPKRRPRVGLAWRSGFHPDRPQFWHANQRRDIPFTDMAAVNLPVVEFFSLQKGDLAESELGRMRETYWPTPNFRNLSAGLRTFAETAAVIANLDLVITVDTAVAHLAGALGAPVWVLLPSVPDWRWLLGRDDSPWYPTMRLFRQTRRGDWPEVIARVRGELAREFAAR